MNNAAERLGIEGRTFTLPQLYQQIGQRLELDAQIPDDIPANVTVTMAAEDAVRVRLHDGRAEITLAIHELTQGRKSYRDFKARAFYDPQSHGLVASLSRNDTIQLEGERLNLRAQIMLRGVFSKLFSQNRPLMLIDQKTAADPRLAGLRVSQFLIDDGWLGLAIGPADRITKRPGPRGAN